jgi:hypothetical protein
VDWTVAITTRRSVVASVELPRTPRWTDRSQGVRAERKVTDSTEASSLRDLTPEMYDRLRRFEQRFADFYYQRSLAQLGDESSAACNAYLDMARRSLIWFGSLLFCALVLMFLGIGFAAVRDAVGAMIVLSAIAVIGLVLSFVRYVQVSRYVNSQFGPNTGQS